MPDADAGPTRAFDWSAVAWTARGQPVPLTCSYCGGLIPADDVPLVLWNESGCWARFCTACQRRWAAVWWGVEE